MNLPRLTSFRLLLALAAPTLLALPARAGHYEAGPTSGLSATSSPGGVDGLHYGNGSCSVPSAGGGNGTGTVGGTLTTTFHWVRDKDADGNDLSGDDPPASVVVTESCAVQMDAKAYNGATPSASAGNGLDARFCANTVEPYEIRRSIPAPPGYTKIGDGKIATSSGTAPHVAQGGETVTATCSPSGSCSPGGNGTFDFTLSYSVSVAPVTLGLVGPIGTSSGGLECMVGRGITGAFSAGGYPVVAGSYQWSIGGTPFKDYFADNSMGKVYNLEAADLQDASPHWFWWEASSVVVNCTATVDLGQGVTASVSAQKGCEVYAPDSYFAANALSDHWTMTDGDSASNSRYAVTWDPTITSGDDKGFCIKFFGSAKTPDRFWEGGPGEDCCVQLAYVWDTVVLAGGIPILNNTDNTWELDNYFPYIRAQGESGYWPADLVTADFVIARDGPSQGLAYDATSFNDEDHYRMYQLYHPTGGVQHQDWAWVPLNYIAWHCNAQDNVPWTAIGSPIPNSIVIVDSFGATSNHPLWEDVFHNNEPKDSESAARKQAKP